MRRFIYEACAYINIAYGVEQNFFFERERGSQDFAVDELYLHHN